MKASLFVNNSVNANVHFFEPCKKQPMSDFAKKLNGDEYFRQHQNFFEQSALTFQELTSYQKHQVSDLIQHQEAHEVSVVPDSPPEFINVHQECSQLNNAHKQKNSILKLDSIPRNLTNNHPFLGTSVKTNRTNLSQSERFKQATFYPSQGLPYKTVFQKPYHFYLDATEAELTLSAYECSEEEQQALAKYLKKEGQLRGLKINIIINGVKK